MKVILDATPKEIADLVSLLQNRQVQKQQDINIEAIRDRSREIVFNYLVDH